MSPEMERKGKVTPCKWAGDTKDADTNSGNQPGANQPGARNLEAERIRSRTKNKNTGGCVKFKTVAEIRRNSVRTELIVGLGASGEIAT